MSYLVFARKFRPQTFLQVSGQEHVTRTLANSVKRDKVAHAYLFAGPRGVGKTSIARIFAKALYCEQGPTPEPCAKCVNCTEIAQGSNLAVREIDGASHNSVENVRDLIESFRAFPPPGSRYKVYIIDEVHMLSNAAFNALLKSLEEPPPNTVFILATTESHKIPETVISRCQRHDFRVLTQKEIETRLEQIASTEALDIEPGVFSLIARLSDGSMRDAQSLLDRLSSFCEGKITLNESSQVLGTVDQNILFNLSQAVFLHDPKLALSSVEDAFARGVDSGVFLKEFVAHFRELLLCKYGKLTYEIELREDNKTELLRQIGMVGEGELQALVKLTLEGCDTALRSAFPRYALEALVVRMATRDATKVVMLSKGEERLENVQKNLPPVQAKPVEVREVSRPKEDTKETKKETKGTAMDWSSFVGFVTQAGQRMLTEQLKRLCIREFTKGVLRAEGPEFSVKYLFQAENKAKLQTLLIQFSEEAKWNVKLELLTEVEGRGSLHFEELKERAQSVEEKRQTVANHPSVKGLQKVFPGSKIEDIRIKE